jgi:hypothetical protein
MTLPVVALYFFRDNPEAKFTRTTLVLELVADALLIIAINWFFTQKRNLVLDLVCFLIIMGSIWASWGWQHIPGRVMQDFKFGHITNASLVLD